MNTAVKELTLSDIPALEAHFLSLGHEARRLRFGCDVNDFAVRSYVADIDFSADAVFGVLHDDLSILGVAHLAFDHEHDCAELGLSVLSGHRNRGIGAQLLHRANVHARNCGARTLYMHTLRENSAMMHLARKQAMQIIVNASEADIWLKLAPADRLSREGEATEQRIALVDHALKAKRLQARLDAAPQLTDVAL